MHKKFLRALAAVLLLAVFVSGCGKQAEDSREPKKKSAPKTEEASTDMATDETEEEEIDIPPEQLDLIKYNYYVDLSNNVIEVIDDITYYFMVVEDAEEFSLIPDTGLTYGYRVYSFNSDIIDDCLMLADMEPSYGELDTLIKEMADPLRALMDTFSEVSNSYDYADNQYAKAREYHQIIYSTADTFLPLGYEFIDAISVMGDARTAEHEEAMLEEGNLIIYNASRGISIGREVLDVISGQDITDETITDLDLTEIYALYDELVTVVDDLNAATSDNNQLIRESLSNSRPFDNLYEALIQALEWMIKQVESGQPLDLSGSGAPLGSIGHFSETLDTCIDRYNTVFVE